MSAPTPAARELLRHVPPEALRSLTVRDLEGWGLSTVQARDVLGRGR